MKFCDQDKESIGKSERLIDVCAANINEPVPGYEPKGPSEWTMARRVCSDNGFLGVANDLTVAISLLFQGCQALSACIRNGRMPQSASCHQLGLPDTTCGCLGGTGSSNHELFLFLMPAVLKRPSVEIVPLPISKQDLGHLNLTVWLPKGTNSCHK